MSAQMEVQMSDQMEVQMSDHIFVAQDFKTVPSVLLIPQSLFDSFNEVRKYTALERIKAGSARIIPDNEMEVQA
jgi:hypothetical protein